MILLHVGWNWSRQAVLNVMSAGVADGLQGPTIPLHGAQRFSSAARAGGRSSAGAGPLQLMVGRHC